MSDTDFNTMSETDSIFMENAKVANSPLNELAELKSAMGMPTEPDPVLTIKPQAEKAPASEEKPGMLSKMMASMGQSDFGAGAQTADTSVEDLGKAGESTQQAAAGSFDAFSTMANAVPDVLNGLEEFMYKRGYTKADFMGVADDANFDFGSMVAPTPVNDSERTARATGKFLTQFSAFMAATVATGGAAAAVGAGATATAVAGSLGGGAAAFVAFDPNEARLSDFVQRYPALQNPITEFLASDPTDSKVEGRFKNALEGVLGDAALAASFAGIAKLYQGSRWLKGKVGKMFNGGAKVLPEINAAEDLTTKLVNESTEAAVENADAAKAVDAETLDVSTQQAAAEAAPLQDEAAMAAAEGNNADAAAEAAMDAEPAPIGTESTGRGKTSAARAVEGMDELAYDKLGQPLADGEFEQLAAHVNADKRISTPEGQRAIFEHLNIKDEAKDGVLTAEQFQKDLSKALQNPQELLAYRPGEKQSYVQATAAWAYVSIAEKSMSKAVDTLLALQASGKATIVQLETAAANLLKSQKEFTKWYGAASGRSSESGRALAALNHSAGESKELFDKLILNGDMVQFSTGSVEEAATLAQNLKQVKELSDAKRLPKPTAAQPTEDMVNHFRTSNGIPDFVGPYAQDLYQVMSDLKHGKIVDVAAMTVRNSMLSNPATHVANVLGSVSQAFFKGVDLVNSALVAGIPGAKKAITEFTPEMAAKYFPGKELLDITAMEKQNFLASQNAMPTIVEAGMHYASVIKDYIFEPFQMRFLTKEGQIGLPVTKFGTSFKLIPAAELEKMGPAARAGHLMANMRTPTKALGVGDAFTGSIAARAEQRLMAVQQAERIAGDDAVRYAEVVDSFMKDPPGWAKQRLLEEKNYALFTKPIEGFSAKFGEMLASKIGLKVSVAPFLTVPVNIVDQAVQRTVGLSYLSPTFRNAMKAGGRERAVALGRVATGTQIMAGIAALSYMGKVTGGEPKTQAGRDAWKRLDKKAYTLKLNDDTEVPFGDIPVIGNLMKMSADISALAPYLNDQDVNIQDLILTAAVIGVDFASTDAILEESGKLTEVLQDPSKLGSYLAQKASGMVTPNVMRQANRGSLNNIEAAFVGGAAGAGALGIPGALGGAVAGALANEALEPDNVVRNTKGDPNAAIPAWDEFLNRIIGNTPGLSKDLPPSADLFGNDVHYPDGMGPNTATEIFGSKDVKMNQELVRLGMSGPIFKRQAQRSDGETDLSLSLPQRTVKIGGQAIDLTPAQHTSFVKLAAGRLDPLVEAGIIDEKQAKAAKSHDLQTVMSRFVSSENYKRITDEARRIEIRNMVREFRQVGQARLIQLYPELSLDSIEGQLNKMGATTGNEQFVQKGLERVQKQRQSIKQRRAGGGPRL